MGGREGPLWKRITYKAPLGTPGVANPGTASVEDTSGCKHQVDIVCDLDFDETKPFTCFVVWQPWTC